MAAVFKCCKNKDCPYLCCVQCQNIFHLSCAQKKKSVVYLDTPRIICSKECQKNKNDEEKNSVEMTQQLDKLSHEVVEKKLLIVKMEHDEEERVTALDNKIEELGKINREKDAYIQTLKRRTRDFEDEVFNAEKKYVDEVNAYKAKIADLGREISECL